MVGPLGITVDIFRKAEKCEPQSSASLGNCVVRRCQSLSLMKSANVVSYLKKKRNIYLRNDHVGSCLFFYHHILCWSDIMSRKKRYLFFLIWLDKNYVEHIKWFKTPATLCTQPSAYLYCDFLSIANSEYMLRLRVEGGFRNTVGQPRWMLCCHRNDVWVNCTVFFCVFFYIFFFLTHMTHIRWHSNVH